MASSTPPGDIFKSLNKAQRRAVSSQADTVAILAGPGSGKTHTLTSRVVWLIDHVGLQPQHVIVATFTVKASNEMRARIGQALGNGREKKIVLGTFHSIARRYLAAYGGKIGLDPKFGIADDADSRGVIKRICERLPAPPGDVPAVRSWISRRKAKGTSDEHLVKSKSGKSVESQAFEQCYLEYQAHLERSNLLDYDDLLVRCVELLQRFPECVSNIQTVLIDEYQDTNGVQYDLMKLFAQQHRRITVVGDPDQSIYGWRSAEIKNLHRLLRDYPGTDEVSLEENYRSSSSILHSSLRVIQQDEARYKKVLLPVHAKGTRPVLRRLQNATTEAEWIVSEIKRIKLMSGGMLDHDDFAVLLRSSSLSRHIESALGREGVPYRMVGGFKFFDRAEIKILIDYLRVVQQPDNNDALARVMNVPKRGIGDTTIKSLLEEAERHSISLWTLVDHHCQGRRTAKTTIRAQTEKKISGELLRLIKGARSRLQPNEDGTPVNLVEVIERLLRDLNFERYLEDTYREAHESRWANVQDFIGLVGDFMRDPSQQEEELLPLVEGVQQMVDPDTLGRFLANVALAADKQTNDGDTEGKPLVTLSTIHAAKGLEWPVVFVPAVYEGSIPHARCDDDAEERRLLYVAMTRAESLLYLSAPLHTAGGNDGGQVKLSRFISDLPSSEFLPKGPSFDRRIMTDIAKILGRELPSEQAIYKNMPLMTAVEDDRFPVDPSDQSGSSGKMTGVQFIPNKKQKPNPPGAKVNVDPTSVDGWCAPYSTTMERAGAFTVPQAPQPAFTTAGQHMAKVAAAEAEKAAKVAAAAPAARPKKSVGSRPPAQRSLLGYGYGITNHDKSKTAPAQTAAPSYPSRSQSMRGRSRPGLSPINSIQPRPAIEPSLAGHKLGNGAMMTKPPRTTDDDFAEAYNCLSSSPTKPSADDTEKENEVPPEDQTRPAASFHATTVTGPVGWRGGGVKRPAPLSNMGQHGMAPIDRLKKPFKLTVKRP